MNDTTIRFAVVGLGNLGDKCLQALHHTAGACVVGVCDLNASKAEEAASQCAAEPYTDARQLLWQVRPDVVVLATPPDAAVEVVRGAVKARAAVVKAGPLARTLDEAIGFVSPAEDADLEFVVLSPRRFQPSYRQCFVERKDLGKLFLARATRIFDWGGDFGWRADQATAGGGVLLDAGYDMLDLLIWMLGLPEDVYAIAGRHGRPHMVEADGEVRSLGIYDTDDTAVVTLRFASAMVGSVTVSWVAHPQAEALNLHGHAGSAEATPDRLLLRNHAGSPLRRTHGDDRLESALSRQIHDIVAAFRKPDRPVESSGREHLLTMAVVEAAYLSNRTGQPESPKQLLSTRGIDIDRCLARQPKTIVP